MTAAVGHDLFLGVHGESYKNVEGGHGKVASAQLDRLTAKGIRQANNVAAYIVEKVVLLADYVADRTINVVSSTYARCEETAARIIRAIGEMAVSLARDVKTKLHVHPGLRGLDLGLFAGMSYEEMAALDPAYVRGLVLWQRGIIKLPPDLPTHINGKPVRGEPNAAFATRINTSMREAITHSAGNPTAFFGSSSAVLGMHQALTNQLEMNEGKTNLEVPFVQTNPGTIEHWHAGESGFTLLTPQGFHEPIVAHPELVLPERLDLAQDMQPGITYNVQA